MASSRILQQCKDDLISVDTCLQLQDRISKSIEEQPYCLPFYRERAWIYEALGFPDLAAMDFYKALLLLDELDDEDAEYHEQATEALQAYLTNPSLQMRGHSGHTVADFRDSLNSDEAISLSAEMVQGGGFAMAERMRAVLAKELPLDIAQQLALIGCFRTASDYLQKARSMDGSNPRLLVLETYLGSKVEAAFFAKGEDVPRRDNGDFDAAELPDAGFVRREVYPWNDHEQDRHSQRALELLNIEMNHVAPDLEVRVTELPLLTSDSEAQLDPRDRTKLDSWARETQSLLYHRFLAKRPSLCHEQSNAGTSRQLGVFARKDLDSGQIILQERSLLTANTRLHEPLCDACGSALPSASIMSSAEASGITSPGPQECPDCVDVLFCSGTCIDLAAQSYHAALCGAEGIDAIVKDVPAKQAADALYTQLLFRSLAMAITQQSHALDLKEVKYIWGDFEPSHNSLGYLPDYFVAEDLSAAELGELRFTAGRRTLPFSFASNILQPLHFITLLDRSVFEPRPDNPAAHLSELWVWQTLLAKFRGTASARISDRDGRPEVAAVHPMWCLVNHSCDPSVAWEWAGDIEFTVRQTRKAWTRTSGKDMTSTDPKQAGIKQGEEVLSHYVDIELGVQERREWGRGALGGHCQCARCEWECE